MCNRHSLALTFSNFRAGRDVRAFASRKQILSVKKASSLRMGIENSGDCSIVISAVNNKFFAVSSFF